MIISQDSQWQHSHNPSRGQLRLTNRAFKISKHIGKTQHPNTFRPELTTVNVETHINPIEPYDSKPLLVTKVYTHLLLTPFHDVYLMPYSSIQYQAQIIKQGRLQKIKIPSEQYYLVVEDRGLLDLSESTSIVSAYGTIGSTKISFVDKNLISDEDFVQPESVIHVVEPTYLTMHVTPGDSWALQEFTDYTIEIKIFDAQQNQIYPSDNLDIKLVSSNEVVITNSTTNGTHHSMPVPLYLLLAQITIPQIIIQLNQQLTLN